MTRHWYPKYIRSSNKSIIRKQIILKWTKDLNRHSSKEGT
jgi:hypothetical protein